MITVGLTGGISTGKSTVAGILRDELNLPVIDADQVSRDITAEGSPGLAWIVEAFGPTVLAEDGSLDRAALREIVASSTDQRRRLEGITHPLIRKEIGDRLTALEVSGAAVAVVEAALMVETGSAGLYDHLIVVSCAPAVQLRRLMVRNGWPKAEAQTWIDSQMPLAEKEAAASVVIRNDGTLKELRAATLAAWSTLPF